MASQMPLKDSMEVDRRKFLKTAGALALGQLVPTDIDPASAAQTGANPRTRGKAPYRVIFSNDFTNIISCTSTYHKRGENWRPEMLEASVDEVAGKWTPISFNSGLVKSPSLESAR